MFLPRSILEGMGRLTLTEAETVRTQPDPVAMVERLRTLGAKHPNLDLQELARRLVQGGHLAPRADWWWTLVALQREPLLRVKRFSPLRA